MKSLSVALSLMVLTLSACSSSGSSNSESPPDNTDNTDDSNTSTSFDTTSEAARYRVTFTGQWDNTFGDVPGSAHFTQIVGSAVNADSMLWTRGQNASQGTASVAETGGTALFMTEISDEVDANTARAIVTSASSNIRPSANASFEVASNRSFPLFTFATMIAPSPDWFVGQSEYSFLNAAGEWKVSETVELRAYDAGTLDGNTFRLGGIDTNPRGVITRLNETVGEITFIEGLVDGQAIARVHFERIE